MPRRVPWQCAGCAWLTRDLECMVFTELAPEGWRTEDGGCQARATPRQRSQVLEACRAYAARHEHRITA